MLTHAATFQPQLIEPGILEAARRPQLSLLFGTQAPTQALLSLYTWLAVHGQTPRLFDGGNRFEGYFVARLARRLSPQPREAMDRMRLSRAFTCYQLAELIVNAPAEDSPLFVLDLLGTFYDESVPLRDVERLLAVVISHLRRMAAAAPVVVAAAEPKTLVEERWTLLEQLQLAADATWMLRPPVEMAAEQPRLF